ncbi:hypothetical protein E2C01_066639 [Portunus trituberculatus]|uniref:Uncharacterized protein n=1 Tax=Portunus trituberculatus TaxID=210409 RepID=A0A5B7HR15_PORTR|nr:hypothetical protein [Portunus trituberculatus]
MVRRQPCCRCRAAASAWGSAGNGRPSHTSSTTSIPQPPHTRAASLPSSTPFAAPKHHLPSPLWLHLFSSLLPATTTILTPSPPPQSLLTIPHFPSMSYNHCHLHHHHHHNHHHYHHRLCRRLPRLSISAN